MAVDQDSTMDTPAGSTAAFLKDSAWMCFRMITFSAFQTEVCVCLCICICIDGKLLLFYWNLELVINVFSGAYHNVVIIPTTFDHIHIFDHFVLLCAIRIGFINLRQFIVLFHLGGVLLLRVAIIGDDLRRATSATIYLCWR